MPYLLSAYYVLLLDRELGTETVAQIFSLPQGSFLAPHLTSSTPGLRPAPSCLRAFTLLPAFAWKPLFIRYTHMTLLGFLRDHA